MSVARNYSIIKEAFRLDAVKFSFKAPFKWASGYYMPIYNDNRLLLSSYSLRKQVVEELVSIIDDDIPQVIGGVPTAGLPWATSLANELKLPLIYVRDKPKSHGLERQIEGILHKGQSVVLVEDVISTGGSVLNAVGGVINSKALCNIVATVFSYDFPETLRKFSDEGIQIRSVFKYQDLIEVGKEEGLIKKDEIDKLLEWQSDPFNWGKKRGFIATAHL